MSSNNTVAAVIEAQYKEMTPTFKKIANYILANLDYLPYETAETISKKVSASSVTVGRFFRSIGYQNIEDIKAALRSNEVRPWLVTNRYQAHQERKHRQQADDLLSLEIEAIKYVHQLSNSVAFSNMVHQLAHAEYVYVIGLQSTRGLMNYCASLLQYMRPNVHFVDGASGAYLEAFGHQKKQCYLLMSDIRTYAKDTKKLCELACEKKLSFGLLTDVYCGWARTLSGDVLMLRTDVKQFWDSTTPIISLINLMLHKVASELGEDMQERLNKNHQLQRYFSHFDI